jgi:predicted transcriptional regulator
VVLSGPNGVIAQTDDATHVLAVSESGVNIDGNIKTQGSKAGFFGATPVTKQTVTGLVNSISDANAKIVIKSILLALKTEGLITDGTT